MKKYNEITKIVIIVLIVNLVTLYSQKVYSYMFQEKPQQQVQSVIAEGYAFNDISNPKTAEQLIDWLGIKTTESDNIMYIISDSYSENNTVLGDYEIIIGLTNDKGLTSIFTLIVRNIDLTVEITEENDSNE